MLPIKSLFLAAFALLTLSGCAAQTQRPTSADAAPVERPTWAFEASDVPVDPGFRFGQLANGMRYIIRQNANPKGTAQVRMEVAAGSLDEGESERGFAHFVEHMAFNGSTNVPEGEMIRLLERKGLAFGADTNASTSFDRTTYMLDLPRNDADLLGTALMLMRETASELTISQEAVSRERGVILAEMRDRNSWQLRNLEDSMAFFNPASLYARRLPIGTTETLNAADAAGLRAFWKREYVPRNTTVIVVGDFPADKVEDAIKARFQSWEPAPAEVQPDAGPVKVKDKGRTDIYIDPAMSERVTASRHGVWLDEPDSVAQRQENLLREIGYGVINRRFQRISRQPDPPFRGAGFGTGDTFRSARTTNLIVDVVDGKWRRGFVAAVEEYRRALDYGFSDGEVAEQIANIRTGSRNAAASASTRSNAALTNAAFALIRADAVPATPQSSLERLELFIPAITPERVLAALKREAVPLKDPLIRFQGRRDPEGGASALRKAWKEGMRARLEETSSAAPAGFAYTDFGAPGLIAADAREPLLDIREVRFENGVRLNLKRTDIEKDRVTVQMSIDGGDMLGTRDNPLATEMASFLPYGGLGKHSQDELQSILAGRTVGSGFDATPEAFVSVAETTPRDLELQLQFMAAMVTDPGYRPEGEIRYRLNINNFFAQMRATPGSALSNSIGGLLSDDDPRFTLQKVDDYRKLTFARLKADISDRLAKGAIEIGVVGDIDEAAVIEQVAKTLGALPPREADFQPYELQRKRPFTAERNRRLVRHTGPADQSIIRLTWPTRDGSDPQESLALEVLERVVRIELTETLREKLGKAYSPSASSTTSLTWRGYGTFAVAASVNVSEIPATRAAIIETLKALRDAPISDDELQRARQPLLEALDNALKTNGGWMTLVDRAQTEADRIERQLQAHTRLLLVSPVQVQDLARKYLQTKDAVEILVLPEGAAVPKG